MLYKLSNGLKKQQNGIIRMLNLSLQIYLNCNEFQDFEQALKWFKQSAVNDNVNAQLYLGNLYEGKGAKKDFKEAFKWFKQQ